MYCFAQTFVQIYSIANHIATLLLSFLGVLIIAAIHFNIFMIHIISLFLTFFHANCRHILIYLRLALYICMMVLYITYICLYLILVKLSLDVEGNPDPKPDSCQSFSICHWIVNKNNT